MGQRVIRRNYRSKRVRSRTLRKRVRSNSKRSKRLNRKNKYLHSKRKIRGGAEALAKWNPILEWRYKITYWTHLIKSGVTDSNNPDSTGDVTLAVMIANSNKQSDIIKITKARAKNKEYDALHDECNPTPDIRMVGQRIIDSCNLLEGGPLRPGDKIPIMDDASFFKWLKGRIPADQIKVLPKN